MRVQARQTPAPLRPCAHAPLAVAELLKSRTDPTELATLGADAAAAGGLAPSPLKAAPGALAPGGRGGQQQQQPQPGPFGPAAAFQQQQQRPGSQPDLRGAMQGLDLDSSGATTGAPSTCSSSIGAAAAAARRLLAAPLADFQAARREWTLRAAKAVAQGFLQHAQGG